MIANCFKKQLNLLLVVVAIFAFFFVLINISLAQEEVLPTDVELPAGPEEADVYDRQKAIEIASESGGPGGCDSVASCDAYCNTPTNQADCMNWARANGVISDENYQKYYNVATSGGPGGCKSTDSCKSYCDDQAHFEECLSHGERQGLISKEQADRARKTGPGGCRTQKDCQAFCENPSNHDVCIDHAVQEGFMTREEAQRIKEFQTRADEFRKKAEEFRKRAEEFERPEVEEIDPGFDEDKARQILATQGGPGGCKTFDECEDFCENPNNQETCFAFAEQHDLFEHKEKAEKIKRIIHEGGPGGCRGEKACHQFCENEANFEVCISFAEKEGLLPPHELERAKKGIQALKEGGPAGCRNKDECERVCQDPANQETCFEWAKKHGLISEEELKFMEEAHKIREEFESKRHEFESRPPEGFKHPEGFQPPGEFLGPGGCRGADECREYCSNPEHAKECQEGFKTPPGSQPPGFGGTPPPQFTQPPHPVCPDSHYWDGKECRLEPQQSVAPYTPPPGVCPDSHYWNGKECVAYPQEPNISPAPYYKSDPEIDCVNSGGRWTGTTCEKPSQEDPARVCAEKGGSWTGTECKLPEQPTSLRDQLFLGAVSRFLLR